MKTVPTTGLRDHRGAPCAIPVEAAMQIVIERVPNVPQSTSRVNAADLVDFLAEFDEAVFYDGDTVLDRLRVGSSPVVVAGDLVVHGVVEDCCEADLTLLIVLGDLRARDVVNCSAMYIQGDVHVDGVVYGNSLCDWLLAVGGDLHARALIEDGHWFAIDGAVDAVTMSAMGRIRDAQFPPERLHEGLVKEVLDDSGIEGGQLMRRLVSGRPVLRASAFPKGHRRGP